MPAPSRKLNHSGPAARFTGKLAGVVAGALAAAFVAAMAPTPAAAFVLGSDDRTRVFRTTAGPARAVVRISFRTHAGINVWCTGFMIDADTVATAGHCIYPRGDAPRYLVSSYRITPAASGVSRPFGTFSARRTFAAREWRRRGAWGRDYGAIRLDRPVGRRTGVLRMLATTASTDSLRGRTSRSFGYPADKAPATIWRATGRILETFETPLLRFNQDMTTGDSGGPVLIRSRSRACGSRRCVVAINSHEDGLAPRSNVGVRITPAVKADLRAWARS